MSPNDSLKTSYTRFCLPLFFILCAAGLLTALFKYVDLTPHVDTDFFFSTDDPQLKADLKIAKIFPEGSQNLVVISALGDIRSDAYAQTIHALSEELVWLPEITAVKSLTHGPDDRADAFASPLWKRILLSEDRNSTNLLILMKDVPLREIIPKIEKTVDQFHAPDFKLKISGAPYIVEQIRRNLAHDLKTFSLFAAILFGLTFLVIFRSWFILLGAATTCVISCALALMLCHFLNVKIGILTANLVTIVLVLTLSPMIFLTFNWKNLSRGHSGHLWAAIRYTFKGSFWSMATTLLGFLSLLRVQAKPLRELGGAGAVGTLIAFLCAYLVYPSFLGLLKPKERPQESEEAPSMIRHLFAARHGLAVMLILGFAAFLWTGVKKLNTDPSLLTYFAPKGPLREGLEYIDRNGGSSPLKLVVKDSQGRKLNTGEAYERLWKLHGALEANPYVGVVISLPTIMAEGKRAPLAFLLTWEGLLQKIEEYAQIAKNFVTDDRQFAFFLLRMKESALDRSRLEVVHQIKDIARRHHFEPEMVGGIYLLQGELARLVVSSLVHGLGGLFGAFVMISFIVTFSFRTSLSILLSLCTIPAIVLGLNGYRAIPLDIISAPALNIAIGTGIDAMLYTAIAVRRRRREGLDSWTAWVMARNQQCRPVLSSMAILCTGFGIFSLSNFPPTQRFGVCVVLGTLMADVAALWVLPFLAAAPLKRLPRTEKPQTPITG